MKTTSLGLLILLTSALLPHANSTTVLPKKHLSNYPMQESLYYRYGKFWIFSFDTSSSSINLLITTPGEPTQTPLNFITYSTNPFDFDVCVWNYSFHIIFITPEGSLNYIRIPYSDRTTYTTSHEKIIIPPEPPSQYSNPSICYDYTNNNLMATYSNTGDGHLYLITHINTSPKIIQITQTPSAPFISKVVWAGGDILIIFSHDATLSYAIYDPPSKVSAVKIITDKLSTPEAWSGALRSGKKPGAMLSYHIFDSSIVLRRFIGKSDRWGPEHPVQDITQATHPLTTRSYDGSYVTITWYDPAKHAFFYNEGNEYGLLNKPIKIEGERPISPKHMSAYHMKTGDNVGFVYTSNGGLSTGFLSAVSTSKERGPIVFIVLRIVVFAAIVFVILKRILIQGG